VSETKGKKVNMPRREFVALGGTSIAAATLGASDPLSATDKVQTIEQQEREIVALTFDVFGTVVDWRTSVIREGEMLSQEKGFDVDWGEFADRWRGGYGPSMNRVRTGELPWTKIDVLHRMVLDELIVEYGLTGLSEEETDHFNRVWHRLIPWPDTVRGLHRLRSQYLITTLSNGNVSLLTNMAKNAGMPWDCILSSELAGHYKPDPEVYLMAAELLSLPPNRVMMVAAHKGDLRAAQRVGLKAAFVARPFERGPGRTVDTSPEPDFDYWASDFEDLAEQLGA
jgi:2-haloacid dehalogenase